MLAPSKNEEYKFVGFGFLINSVESFEKVLIELKLDDDVVSSVELENAVGNLEQTVTLEIDKSLRNSEGNTMLVNTESGQTLNNLVLIKEDGEKSVIPIETVYDIYVFSDIVINSDLLDFLGSAGVSIHFFNYYGYYSGTFYAREKMISGDLLVKQVEHYTDSNKRVQLAKQFIKGAAENILRNLKYYLNRGRNLQCEIETINELSSQIGNCSQIPEIMGVEGNIRKVYYSCFPEIILQETNFTKRVKRPPDNMVNSLISFLNSVFYTKVISEIYKTQLNPSISYLHSPSSKRFSLSLDVSEVFKPLIVDRLIFKLLNKNMISESDFVKDSLLLKIKQNKIKMIMQEFDNVMLTTIKHRTLNRDVSYRHLIRLELYKIIKHLIGDKQYSPFKIWW